jgi:hypothetical protein
MRHPASRRRARDRLRRRPDPAFIDQVGDRDSDALARNRAKRREPLHIAHGLDRACVLAHRSPDALGEALLHFDPSEFHDARVDGDRLTLHVGEDAQITFEPCVDVPTVPPGRFPGLNLM